MIYSSIRNRKIAGLLVTTLLSTAWSSGALAQGNDAERADASGTEQEIIVTARKRDERAQDVPVAMSIMSTQDLERYDTNSIVEIGAQTPALLINTSNSGQTGGSIVLRGVSSDTSSISNQTAIVVNLDGIQVGQGNVLFLGVQDIERVEVLKGPQTLFFGKNSPGGVISIISASPTKEFQAKLRTGYEFAADRGFIEGFVSSPLTPTIGVRIAGYLSKQKGYFRNDARPTPSVPIPPFLGGGTLVPGEGTYSKRGPRNTDYLVRGTLAYEAPGGEFDAKLKVAYGGEDRRSGLTFGTQVFACGAPGGPFLVRTLHNGGSTDCELNRYVNDADAPARYRDIAPAYRNGHNYFENEQFLAGLTLNWKPVDELTITSVTGLYDLREDFTSNFSYSSLNVGSYASQLDVRQYTQELRATTDFKGMLNFMVGAFYQDEKLTGDSQIIQEDPFTTLFTGGFLHGTQNLLDPAHTHKTKAWSVFAQVIADITPQLQISAGGRYSKERKSISTIVNPTPFNALPYEVNYSPSRRTFNDFSPEVTVSYKPVDNLTLYGAFKEGFKSGGFNLSVQAGGFGSRNAGDLSFGQETVRGGEIGAKGSLLDRQLGFSLALYNYKYSGLQTSAYDAQALTNKVTNAGSARVKGVELSADFRPHAFEGLSLRSAVAYNHARYIVFNNGPCYGGQSQAAGCNLIAVGPVIRPALPTEKATIQDLSGQPLPRAPDWSGNAGLTYEFNVGGGYMLSLSGDAFYTGDYMAHTDPRSHQKAAWRLNAGATLRSPGDRWELSLIGTNLTNVLRISGAFTASLTGTGTGTNVTGASDLVGNITDPIGVTLSGTVRF